MNILELVSKYIGYIVAIGSGLAALYGWVAKPIKDIKEENRKQSKMLDGLDDDTADLLCSQLVREREYYLRHGYCPAADKQRIGDLYRRYKKRGRNHIVDSYMDDILKLPDERMKKA